MAQPRKRLARTSAKNKIQKNVIYGRIYRLWNDVSWTGHLGHHSGVADMLFIEASDVDFYVGQSINAAHQGLPIDITMKLKLVKLI